MGHRYTKNNPYSYDIAHKNPTPSTKINKTAAAVEPTKSDKHDLKSDISEQDSRIPEWVNKDNFKKLLLQSHSNIKDIKNFKAFPALTAGENYATLMVRVQITAKFDDDTSKDFSFMLKLAHESKEMKNMTESMNFFIKENSVYTEVIPELEDMYRKAGVDIKFGPKFYSLDLEDANIMYTLLDDLKVNGFKNANRLECLDMEHALSVLRKMAQFHAASACRVAMKDSYPQIFSPDMDNEMARDLMHGMVKSFKEPFLENLKTYDNGEKYYDSMNNFFDNLCDLFVNSRKMLSGYFCVLNHGDLWSNNIMFKYAEDGSLDDTLFIDFQNTNWGSPTMDLYYFIISSVRIDIKLSQFDYFIRYYHDHLSNYLKWLKYPLEIPTLRDLNVQLIDFGSMATVTSFITMGAVLLDPTDSAKFENFLGDSEECKSFKTSMFSNERYRKYINEILPWLYNRGFMEINLTDIDNKIAAAEKLKQLDSQQKTKSAETGHQL